MPFPIEEKLLLSFEIFSFTLYFIIIIYLNLHYKKNKEFFSLPFIIQFTFNGICDLVSASSVIFFRKIAIWGWLRDYFEENDWVTILYRLVFYQFTSLTITGNFLITLNRYMTMANPIFYKNKWTPNFAICIVILQILVCFGIFSHLYFVDAVFVYDASIPTWYFTKSKWIYSLFDSICLTSISWFSAIGTGVLNFKICLQYSKIMKSAVGSKRKNKICLFVFTLITCTFLYITAIQQTVRLKSAIDKDRRLRNLMNYYFFYMLPMLSCIHAYLMIFLSRKIREDFFSWFYRCILGREFTTVTSIGQPSKWTVPNHNVLKSFYKS
uniref:Serpentine receptor class gamma n=1 Tax=Strongyloides papillosus TaxID=174720 RepID=A0A0N5B6L7_STREA